MAPQGSMYTTLLMSTGLTLGTISSFFGLQAGIINQSQYAILVGVVASAVIPTFIIIVAFHLQLFLKNNHSDMSSS